MVASYLPFGRCAAQPHAAPCPEAPRAAVLVPVEPRGPAPPVARLLRRRIQPSAARGPAAVDPTSASATPAMLKEDQTHASAPTTSSPKDSAPAAADRCSLLSADPAMTAEASPPKSTLRWLRNRASRSATPGRLMVGRRRRAGLAGDVDVGRVPTTSAARPGDPRARPALRGDTLRQRGADVMVGGFTAGGIDFADVHRRPAADSDRRGSDPQLPAVDGRVPQLARAAEGSDHEPALGRRGLRRDRAHLPMGLGEGV